MKIWVLQRHVLHWTQDTERGRRTTKHNTENYKHEQLGIPQQKRGYTEMLVILIVKSGKHINWHQGDMGRKSRCFSFYIKIRTASVV